MFDQAAESRLACFTGCLSVHDFLQRVLEREGPPHGRSEAVETVLDDVVGSARLDVVSGRFLIDRAGYNEDGK